MNSGSGARPRDHRFWRWAVIALCLWATAWSADSYGDRGSIVASLDGAVDIAEEVPDEGDVVQPMPMLASADAQTGMASLLELRAPQAWARGEARRHNRGPPRA